MVEINLLPWRERRRQYEQKMMRVMIAGSLTLMLMVIVSLHVVLSMQINRKTLQVRELQAMLPDIAEISSQKNAADNPFAARQFSGVLLASLLDDAARAADSGICYERIARHDNSIELEGKALSVQSMASGLQILGQTHNFSAVRLRDLKKDPAQDALQFVLSLPTLNDESAA